MNYNQKYSFFRVFFSLIIAIAFIVGLAFLSSLIKEVTYLKYVGYTCFIITMFLIIKNAIILGKRHKKFLSTDFHDEYNKIMKYKERINEFEKVYAELRKQILNTNLYIILVLILQILTFITLAPTGTVGILLCIIPTFLIIDIVTALLNRFKEKNQISKNEINEYPYIKNIIKKCREKFGIKDEIITHLSLDDAFSVTKVNNKIYLSLGIGSLAILSEEEFENILFHEMAHIFNEDTQLSYKVLRSCYLVNNLDKIFISFGLNFLIFTPIFNKLKEEVDLFMHFIKLEREKKADAFVIENGNRNEFINGLAKTLICHYQDEYRFPFNVFVYEKPMEDYVDLIINERIKNYYEKEEMYNHLLINTVQRQFDTHQSLKQRMEHLQVDDFKINFNFERSEKYQNEIDRIKKRFSRRWYDSVKGVWEQNREYNYYFYVKEYDKIKDKDFDLLQIDDKLKFAYCKLVFNKPKEAMEAYDKILIDNPNNVFALLNRAFIKFGINDFSCIEDFEKAKKLDISKTEMANFYIGTILNNNGREDLLQEYRKNNIEEMNKLIQSEKYSFINKEKAYSESDLPNNIIEDIKEKISKYDCLKGVYLLKKKTNEESHLYILAVEFDLKKKEEDRKQTADDLVIFASSISEYLVYFDDITFSISFKKLIKKKNIKNLKEELF